MAATTSRLESKPIKPSFSTQDLFDLIYTGAKAKDITKIQSALLHAGVNIQNGLMGTPAYQLALEGTTEAKEALDFLIKTNPSERFALLKEMASGYAIAGNTGEVNKILSEAANPSERLALLQEIIAGFARGGHEGEVSRVLALAANPSERFVLWGEMGYGYARGGHEEQVSKVLALAANPLERLCLVRSWVIGYAQGGHKGAPSKFLTSTLNPAERLELLREMACCYAQSRQMDEANKVLALAANPSERLGVLKSMAFGYARGGHVSEAIKLLTLVRPSESLALLSEMAAGCASGGHAGDAKLVSTLLAVNPDETLLLFQEMAYFYALGGHVSQANNILTKAPNRAAYLAILQIMACAYAITGQEDEAKKMWESAKPDERLAVLHEMAYGYASSGRIGKANEVLTATQSTQRLGVLQSMISGYIQGGHLGEANKLLTVIGKPDERLAVFKAIAGLLKAKGIFLNSESALFMLAVFSPRNQRELATELAESKEEMKLDVTALVPKATQLHPYLTMPSPLTRPINFQYRLGTHWPQVQELLLMTGVDLVKKGKLNSKLLLLLSTFLAPISSTEALDLSNKFFVKYRPHLFYADLASHKRLLTTGGEVEEAKISPTKKLGK